MTSPEPLARLLELSIPERLRLVEALWDSIAETPEAIELPEEHRRELDRRLEAYRQDPRAGSSWPEVKARIRRGS
jgi:putative addiction module component (TIGR02574 family)